MRVVTITEKAAHKQVFRLHHLTDLHVGAPDFDEQAFLERRKLIERDPNARWIMGGDAGDLITHHDRRYAITSLDPRYRNATDVRHATREHLVELFDPIKEKCWGWADGNHEHELDKHHGGHFGVEVCCDLGIEDRFVGYRGFVDVTFAVTSTMRLQLLVDVQHGWQVGRLKGAVHVQAEREIGITEADIVVRGHNHQPAAHPFITLGVAKGRGGVRVVRRDRTLVNGGTWRRGYRDNLERVDRRKLSEFEGDLWHETKGFRAEPIGGPVLLLAADAGRSEDRERGIQYVHARLAHTIVEHNVTAETLGLPT